MKRWKRVLGLLVAFVMLTVAAMVPVSAAGSEEDFQRGYDKFLTHELTEEDLLGSWYGQYTGNGGWTATPVERYMHMTIEEIDDFGNLSGTCYVTTVQGQGQSYDKQWYTYRFEGRAMLMISGFFMHGVEILESSGELFSMVPFNGMFYMNEDEELYVKGTANNEDSKPFYFAKVSNWAKDEITEANQLGLIPEVLQGKDLERPVTRAEFAAIAVRLYERLIQRGVYGPEIPPFTDIAGHKCEEAIRTAYFLNIAVGVSDTEFAPDLKITREQLATMLCRVVKKYKFPEWKYANDNQYALDYAGVPPFADDYEISDYAKPSVYYMVKMGVIKGIDETHFAPRNVTAYQEAEGYATATREQAIAIALRIYQMSYVK